MARIGCNGWKWLDIAENGCKWHTWMIMSVNGCTGLEVAGSGQKWLEKAVNG